MSADFGAFEAFYAGPIQHPILLWGCAALGAWFALTRRNLAPSMRRYCAGLALLSGMDAWLTTNVVFGLGPLPASLGTVVPLFFVLMGDLRFLLLVTCATPEGGLVLRAKPVLIAIAATLIVPILSQLGLRLLPDSMQSARAMFLIYEVAFACLTLALLRWAPQLRRSPWLRSFGRYVILYYFLWAGADAIILATGSDLGFAVRVLPNWLYYGGFIGVLGWLAASAGTARPEST
jgi:hypothetical protein